MPGQCRCIQFDLSLDEQSAPILMRLSVFRRLVANERVRFIEGQSLFERPVQSLLIRLNKWIRLKVLI